LKIKEQETHIILHKHDDADNDDDDDDGNENPTEHMITLRAKYTEYINTTLTAVSSEVNYTIRCALLT
jgi:hypothetical protein